MFDEIKNLLLKYQGPTTSKAGKLVIILFEDRLEKVLEEIKKIVEEK